MQEKSPREVEREFGLKDKSLESLRDRASGFAGMVAAFCQRMKFTQLELLIAKFQVHYICGFLLTKDVETSHLPSRVGMVSSLPSSSLQSLAVIGTMQKAADYFQT